MSFLLVMGWQGKAMTVPPVLHDSIRITQSPDTLFVESVDSVAINDTLPSQPLRIARRELLSVKTNLLFYGVYLPGPIPNVAVEYYPKSGHFTYGASIDFPWWIDYSRHKFFEVRNYQVETRYYFKANGANKANGAYEAEPNRPYEPYEANESCGQPAFSGFSTCRAMPTAVFSKLASTKTRAGADMVLVWVWVSAM